MKKFLLTAVLILAVLTSLTAGTLASYVQEQSIDGNVKPMYFQFTKAGTLGFNSTVKLAPGKSQMYAVDVKNWSEMPVSFTTEKLFSGTNGYEGLLNAKWYKNIEGTGDPADSITPFQLMSGEAITLYLKVVWDDTATSNDVEVNLSQNPTTAAKLTVKITGTSV